MLPHTHPYTHVHLQDRECYHTPIHIHQQDRECYHTSIHIHLQDRECYHTSIHIHLQDRECYHTSIHIHLQDRECYHTPIHIHMYTYKIESATTPPSLYTCTPTRSRSVFVKLDRSRYVHINHISLPPPPPPPSIKKLGMHIAYLKRIRQNINEILPPLRSGQFTCFEQTVPLCAF